MTSGAFETVFRPAWWLPGGHPQTLWRKFSPTEIVEHTRQRIDLDDGDFIDLDWARQPQPDDDPGSPIVFLLHGLCGCSGSSYILALQKLLNQRGIASVAMNFRGCSGEVNRLAQAYHSGISSDLDEVFQKLVAQYGDRQFVFVGYSLGANVLLKWLGEIESHPNVQKAVAVSTPFSLDFCSKAMLVGLSQFYGRYFLRRLVSDVQMKKSHFASTGNDEQLQILDDLGPLDRLASIWEFDDNITAPLHGYADANEYYTTCSSHQFLPRIATRTILIQSRDDPLIPPSAIPDPGHLPAAVEMLLSPKGGHVGFISGKGMNWLETEIVRFIESD